MVGAAAVQHRVVDREPRRRSRRLKYGFAGPAMGTNSRSIFTGAPVKDASLAPVAAVEQMDRARIALQEAHQLRQGPLLHRDRT